MNVFIAPKASSTKDGILRDVRQIVNKTTGNISYVLCFEDAEVIMPGNWEIRESEFPKGLYDGQRLAAYWEEDESGVSRFHLYEVE